jgi:alanine racemase
MSGRDSRAWVEVDLAAITDNARAVARIASARLLPAVKANAYGLGAVAVSRALEALDPWGYVVATVEEGAELRDGGIDRRILVLMPARADLFDAYAAQRLTPAIGDVAALRAWVSRGHGAFHLEIDTGMSRTGIRWDEIETCRDALETPLLEGAFTQFHSAEQTDGSAERQQERFEAAIARMPRRPALLHCANSAAVLRDSGGRFVYNLVRPGVYLYGGSPGGGLPEGRPVVALRARVVSVRQIHAGETVSYNASWTAPRETTVATLGVGYGDGVPRTLGINGEGYVLLNGARPSYAGLVTMDLTMVETRDAPPQVGDIATLVGKADGDCVTLEQFSGWAEVLQRQFLTGLGSRLPRVYR